MCRRVRTRRTASPPGSKRRSMGGRRAARSTAGGHCGGTCSPMIAQFPSPVWSPSGTVFPFQAHVRDLRVLTACDPDFVPLTELDEVYAQFNSDCCTHRLREQIQERLGPASDIGS